MEEDKNICYNRGWQDNFEDPVFFNGVELELLGLCLGTNHACEAPKKGTKFSRKLVKSRRALLAERRNACFSVCVALCRTNPRERDNVCTAYQHVRRASYAIVRLSYNPYSSPQVEPHPRKGWSARESRTSEKCEVETREKPWLGWESRLRRRGQMLKLPRSSQSCKSCTACAIPCSALSSLSNPHSSALQRKCTTNAIHDALLS
jgi:hypothetical protein